MALRNYSNSAPVLALTTLLPASSGSVTLNVASTSGWPSPPFTIGLDRGTATQEVCTCTAMTSTTFTVVRADDNTSLQIHQVGATVEQVSSARDFSDANALVNTLTTLGDIMIFGSTDKNQRLPIGPNGYSLTADSTQANGLAWEQTVPPGTLAYSTAEFTPAGWLTAQHQAVLRTTYAALWSALGTTSSPWGQGDGSTTFNVPYFANIEGVGNIAPAVAIVKY